MIRGVVSRPEKHRIEVQEEVVGQRSLEDLGVRMREEMVEGAQGTWVGLHLHLHRLVESGRARTHLSINQKELAAEDDTWLREVRDILYNCHSVGVGGTET